MSLPFVDGLIQQLHRLAQEGLLRRARPVDTVAGPTVTVDGRLAINFASNNYLGLADHPTLIAAAQAATVALGTGTSASRLIAGSQPPHREIESRMASYLEVPAVLLFNSGYHANIGMVSGLAGEDDLIVSDALNHASLIDGCRLSRARVVVAPHRDLAAIDTALQLPARHRFIVSDTVFSMDGDLADVRALRAVADRHQAVLMLDDAHAVGVLGPLGRGAAAAVGVRADVWSGTFGKAFGGFGAFVAGDMPVIEWLRNRARPFIFSTAIPASVAAAAVAALDVITGPEGDARRDALFERIAHLREGLAERGWLAPGAGETSIFPLVVGDAARTIALSDALLERGVFAQGVRPPTVAPGSSRLRMTLMASHTPAHVETLLDSLDALRHLFCS